LVTTLHAPITAPFQILTPSVIVEFAPIHTSSSMMIGHLDIRFA